MIKILSRLVIKQFSVLLYENSKKNNIRCNRKKFRLVSRQLFDRLVLEIFYEDKNIEDDLLVPKPIVTVDFTNLLNNENNSSNWNLYLNKKVIELLKKIEKYDRNKILSEFYKNDSHFDFIPRDVPKIIINDYTSSYREEFVLSYKKQPKRINEPYKFSNDQNKDNKDNKYCFVRCYGSQPKNESENESKNESNELDIIDSIRSELESEKITKKIKLSSCENIFSDDSLNNKSEINFVDNHNSFTPHKNTANILDLLDSI